MLDGTLRVGLLIDAGGNADARVVDELTTGLRRQLLELDLESVDQVRAGEGHSRTRATEVVVLGGLLVPATKSCDLVKIFTLVVRSEVAGCARRRVEPQIEADTAKEPSVCSEEQRQLFGLFVERYARAD
jgi:hypothetical protein